MKTYICLFLTLLNSYIFCGENVNISPDNNEKIEDNQYKRDNVKKAAKTRPKRRLKRKLRFTEMGGLGIIAGFGAARGFGDINYEYLAGQSSSDTGHVDENSQIAVFSGGIRFGYTYAMFFFLGYKIDLTFQRMGMKIDNSKFVVNSVQTNGSEVDLYLDYIVLNPSFNFSFISIGLYFGFLVNAQVESKNVKDKIRNFDFGITVAMDIPLPVTKYKDAVHIIFEGVFGTIDILKDSDKTCKNLGFYFKLAYLFNLKSRIK